jgi:CubicO group peptidase (beta-lactamase class C family)
MSSYIPSADRWERIDPPAAGMSGPALEAAAAFARQAECDWPASLYLPDGRYVGTAHVNDKPPHDQAIGIVRPRGGASGIVLRGGRIVAEWGDTHRPDTTFSVAKSYLAIVAGLAFDDGRIRSLDDRVTDYAPAGDDGFLSPHNAAITWRQLLQQTSEWQGTLWGKPDSVDHHRDAGPRTAGTDNLNRGTQRVLEQPGARWEYNDVRVNRLALSLTQLFGAPLGEVLRERVMVPIGASSGWEWHGYDNARVSLAGREVVSVSGGGHWGAGLFISTRDHARVGLLMARLGDWGGRQLLSRDYIAQLATPSPANPQYGFLWWLNTDRKLFPSIAANAVLAIGGGQHLIWTDAARDLVAVLRWVDRSQCDTLLGRIAASISTETSS